MKIFQQLFNPFLLNCFTDDIIPFRAPIFDRI